MPKQPISPYGSSKLTVETYAETFSNVFGFKATMLRFSNVYGRYSQHKNSVVSKFIKLANNNNKLKDGFGTPIRDFIHVDDIAQVLLASIKYPRQGAIYNVCDDIPAPPEDVIAYAAELLGMPIPLAVDYNEADMTPMARSFYAENKRVRNDLIKEELGIELKFPIMTSQHMIEHLELTYRIASGETQDFEIVTPEKYLEKVQESLYSFKPMPSGFDFPMYKKGKLEELKHENLQISKLKLLEARKQYINFYKENPDGLVKNAVFGFLEKYEWQLLERNLQQIVI